MSQFNPDNIIPAASPTANSSTTLAAMLSDYKLFLDRTIAQLPNQRLMLSSTSRLRSQVNKCNPIPTTPTSPSNFHTLPPARNDPQLVDIPHHRPAPVIESPVIIQGISNLPIATVSLAPTIEHFDFRSDPNTPIIPHLPHPRAPNGHFAPILDSHACKPNPPLKVRHQKSKTPQPPMTKTNS